MMGEEQGAGRGAVYYLWLVQLLAFGYSFGCWCSMFYLVGFMEHRYVLFYLFFLHFAVI